jgi:3-hydroxyisobutyrate dehydrogenase-like beta-hydroxyacid dehydrogenase
MKIAFIGFGEAGQAFRKSLAEGEPALTFSAYDKLLDTEGESGPCAQAIRTAGVALARSTEEAVSQADWVISAVTADQSFIAASTIAPHVRSGQIYFDINSVSPQRKRDSAALFRAGAIYVDMAVMAPVHPAGHRTATLLAGVLPGSVVQRLGELGFVFDIAGAEVGAATAIKMVRSLFVKGLEAITVETLLAAEASGCLDHILGSLGKTYPGLKLPGFALYQFERTTRHGKRRAAEMRESAATLNELGLTGRLADAIADVQERVGGIDGGGETLEAVVRKVLAGRRS